MLLQPHPAFDLSLLPPDAVQTLGHSVAEEGHYSLMYLNSIAYLNSIDARTQTFAGLYDVVGCLAMWCVSFGSIFMSLFCPVWLLDTSLLNLIAFHDRPQETMLLRQALLLEGILWGHGLAMAYVYHLRGILTNTDQLDKVQPMLAEFGNRRVHLTCFLQTLKPSIFTRAFLVMIQAVTLPLYFTIGLVYPSLCHAGARFHSFILMLFYEKLMTKSDKGGLPRVIAMEAPPVAMWYYKLPVASRFDLVLKYFSADNLFHGLFNGLFNAPNSSGPILEVAKYMATAPERRQQ